MRILGVVLILAIALVALVAPGGFMNDMHGNQVGVGDVVQFQGPNHDLVGLVTAVSPDTNTLRAQVPVAFGDAVLASQTEILRTGDGRKLKAGPYKGYRSQGEALNFGRSILKAKPGTNETAAPV